MRRLFSIFGDDEDEAPPKKAAPADKQRPASRQGGLAAQMREYLMRDILTKETAHAFCKRTGYPTSSLNHILTGTGMHIHSLERLAQTLGWSVVITDEDGKTVAEL